MADDLVGRLSEDPARAAVLLDVDGTLAPIVERPEDARVPDETRARARPARRAATRSSPASAGGRGAEVERMLGVQGVAIVGEHGLELAPDAEALGGRPSRRSREASTGRPSGSRSASRSTSAGADDEAAARAYLERVADAAEAEGLVPRWGRMVLEIRPPVAADKGTAVARWSPRAGVERALYAGDDTTDVDAFRGLDGSSSPCVSRSTPARRRADLVAAADLVVDGTDGVLALLRAL